MLRADGFGTRRIGERIENDDFTRFSKCNASKCNLSKISKSRIMSNEIRTCRAHSDLMGSSVADIR